MARTTRGLVLLAVGVALLLILGSCTGEKKASGRKKVRASASPSPSVAPSASPSGSPHSETPSASASPTPTPTSSSRRAALESAAIALVVDQRLLPTRDGDFDDPARYCPRERTVVSWEEPSGSYQYGSFLRPVGPAPTDATTQVNGIILCEGSTYAYVGFEASWDSSAGRWNVLPVPGD